MTKLENVIVKTDGCNNFFDCGIYSLLGTREYQQDYAGFVEQEDGLSGIICDGMGGLRGGERASSEAVKLYVCDYNNLAQENSISEFLFKEAHRLDELVYQLKDSNGNFLKAGSTLVSVIVKGSALYWLSVGDSRIYIMRGDSMVQVTTDHNYRTKLNEFLAEGKISRDRYETEISGSQTEALISYLGMGGIECMDGNKKPFQLVEDDVILLCSDGLYKSLEADQIMALLTDNKVSAKVAAKRLTNMALEQAVKGQDNTTVMVIHYKKKKEREECDALL